MPSSRQELHPAPSRDLTEGGAAASVSHTVAPAADSAAVDPASRPIEVGGREGPEPTRFGDWERRGRCIDF